MTGRKSNTEILLERACQPPRALVVDDEPEFLEIFGVILDTVGCEWVGAQTRKEAEEKLSEDIWDIVFVDIRLGPDSGIYVIRRSLAIQPDVPIVVVTGFVNESALKESMNAGASAVLIKPRDTDDIEVVRRVLKAFHLRVKEQF